MLLIVSDLFYFIFYYCVEDRGVIWRFFEDLFLQMTSNDHSHLRLSVSCVALCGDELKDLLRPEAKQFHIIEDQNGRTGKVSMI